MQIEAGWLLICGIVGFVFLINFGLAYSLFSGSAKEQLDLMGRAYRRARDPWQDEDRDLTQLRQLVDHLKSSEQETEHPS